MLFMQQAKTKNALSKVDYTHKGCPEKLVNLIFSMSGLKPELDQSLV